MNQWSYPPLYKHVCPASVPALPSQRMLLSTLSTSKGHTASSVYCLQVATEGVAVAPSQHVPWHGSISFAALARSVVRIMQAGWPAAFILAYDQVVGR
jgi:hypothetical protein